MFESLQYTEMDVRVNRSARRWKTSKYVPLDEQTQLVLVEFVAHQLGEPMQS